MTGLESFKSYCKPYEADSRKPSRVGGQREARSTSNMRMRMSSKTLSSRLVESYVELEYKREKFLERHRVAASKCREKKKLSTSNLGKQARELTWQRHMVTQHIALLRNELLELKCKCLEHIHCDCEQIRECLRSTVAQLNPVGSLYYQNSDSHSR
jgi:uncharacterized coiled-coil DUF342 family protein